MRVTAGDSLHLRSLFHGFSHRSYCKLVYVVLFLPNEVYINTHLGGWSRPLQYGSGRCVVFIGRLYSGGMMGSTDGGSYFTSIQEMKELWVWEEMVIPSCGASN